MNKYHYTLIVFSIAILSYFFFFFIPKDKLIINYKDKKSFYKNIITNIDNITKENFEIYKMNEYKNKYSLKIDDCKRIYLRYDGEVISKCVPLSNQQKNQLSSIISTMEDINVSQVNKHTYKEEGKYKYSFRVGSYITHKVAQIAVYTQEQNFDENQNRCRIEKNTFLEIVGFY